MKDAVITYLNGIQPLSEALNEWLTAQLDVQSYPQKTLVQAAGDTSNRIAFVLKGMLRLYYYHSNGIETTSWFIKEGDVMISVISFYDRVPGIEYIETLEDVVLASITYDQLEETYRQFPEFNRVGRLLTEKYYKLSQERLQATHHTTAEERYAFLRDKHPEILARVSGKYIASYLGIDPATLSRLRKRLLRNGR
jgi:CRP/FNR family transcriptional regulator, anaerobic regulatory protein